MHKSKKEVATEKANKRMQPLRQNQSTEEKEVVTEEAKKRVPILRQNQSTEKNVLASKKVRRLTHYVRQNKYAKVKEVAREVAKKRMRTLCQEETEEHATQWRRSSRLYMNQSRSNPNNEPTAMEKAIADVVEDSLKTLHRTEREGNEEKANLLT